MQFVLAALIMLATAVYVYFRLRTTNIDVPVEAEKALGDVEAQLQADLWFLTTV